MANINKKEAVSQAVGLPTKEQMLTSPANRDTLSAKIQNTDGTETPAALTEGEFVFAVPAIIALGEGDYDQGVQLLTQLHEELRNKGDMMMAESQPPQQQGLAGAASPVPME